METFPEHLFVPSGCGICQREFESDVVAVVVTVRIMLIHRELQILLDELKDFLLAHTMIEC